ncbi:hypothetical protein AGDE_13073 [Angomonas deanei]|uniref:Uncharacterized protein n=1 Tax=Angomonas deanei TaxID=59799 RepID=A0A7G2CIA0_9TRYP|nr:hypothetical protein AGDE_13073 [Angomonas deanei]CAD2218644.1 hypothetical protein, conserved [Angomonas deanei]|eukprot:EPY22800.1 hypothetical protein AGDE_13073 [Angomonas deanei]
MSTQDALASLSQGDIESAKTILDNATQVTGGESSMESVFAASCMRAAIAAMEGSAEEVKRVMGGSSKRNDPHWDALTSYQEGLSQMALGNYKLAKSKFLESKNKDPCFFVANIGIAALLFQEKKYKESFAKYKEAIFYLGSEKVPPVARVGMALCAFYLDDKEFAEKTLDVALSVNQEDELALLARLLLYVEKQNLQKISETVDQLSRVTPSNPWYC